LIKSVQLPTSRQNFACPSTGSGQTAAWYFIFSIFGFPLSERKTKNKKSTAVPVPELVEGELVCPEAPLSLPALSAVEGSKGLPQRRLKNAGRVTRVPTVSIAKFEDVVVERIERGMAKKKNREPQLRSVLGSRFSILGSRFSVLSSGLLVEIPA
jgi:hypothetical protein